jgi:hypothetical protein
MKVFRILCLIIHNQVSGLPALVKDSFLLPNCLQTITKVREKKKNTQSNLNTKFFFFLQILV